MGKSRDLFKKIRDINGIFYAKMGKVKDRNGIGLKEAEDIKKRWQEYTEVVHKKDLHDPDNHKCGFTPGVGDGQGGLVCSSSWGCKELDMTEPLN